MERRMESRETMHDETMAEGGSGDVTRSLPASEQFSTRFYARCASLFVYEWKRCGHRIDP